MLQIKVQRIHGGLTDVFKTSPGEWEKYIPDLRQNAEQLSQSRLNDESYVALILSEIGYYLGCFRTIKGRSGDLTVAWLFIPNDLEFKGIEIERRINEIRGIISEPEIDKEEEEGLMKICQDTFSKKEKDFVSPLTVDNASKKYAFRRYGKGALYSLNEILDRLEQDYYTKFSAIALIESGDWDASVISSWEDLTDLPLIHKLHYRLPLIPQNYTFIIDNDKFESNDSKTVRSAENIFIKDLTVKRDGYVDLQIPHFHLEDLTTLDLQKQEWNKIIPVSNFQISSPNIEKGMRINSHITIEGVEKSGDKWIIPEKDFKEKQFEITVKADGYDTHRQKASLCQVNPIKIELKKKEKEHIFQIKAVDRPVTFSLTSRNNFNASPLKGYKIKGKPKEDTDSTSYTLVYKPFAFMRGIVSKILLVIAILALIGLGYYLGNTYPLEDDIPKTNPSRITEIRPTGDLQAAND